MRRITADQFASSFPDSFTEDVFRLELLDHYVAANEAEPLKEFASGRLPAAGWREPWKRFVRSVIASGRSMARVHVVTEPLTLYTLFEITCVYPANVDAGEDVRVLPRQLIEANDLPGSDYWLLDSERVALMDYDDNGNWLGVDVTDRPDIVSQCRRARDITMEKAIPLNDYLAHLKTSEDSGHGRRAS